MFNILFTGFEDGVFYFRCFIAYSSCATLSYNTQSGAHQVVHDDPTNNVDTLHMEAMLTRWIEHLKPNIEYVLMAVRSIQKDGNERLLAQILNHSMKQPELYTGDYWRTLPSLLTFSLQFEDVQAQQPRHDNEIPLLLT